MVESDGQKSLFKTAKSKLDQSTFDTITRLYSWSRNHAHLIRFGTGAADGSFTFLFQRKLDTAKAVFKAAVASLNARRIDLQLAVNNARPHTNADNATVRRAFQIPVNQAYAPTVKTAPPT